MADNLSKTVEGTVSAVRKDNSGVLLMHEHGEEWFSYTQPQWREQWVEELRKGDHVKLSLNGGMYDDKVRWFVKGITLMAPTPEKPSASGERPAYSNTSRSGEFRTPQQIIRTEALRMASEALAVRTPVDYDLSAFSAAAVVLAAEWADWIEGDD